MRLDAVRHAELKALQDDGSVEATARLENLRELVGSIRDYEVEIVSAGDKPALDGFLERVTLRTDGDDVQDGGAVTLMTVHAAKGLEFRNVIITGMEEDMFPYRSLQGTRPDDIEEERRLAYVAWTRARRSLTLVYDPASPSQFLLEAFDPRELELSDG